eukprot:TRINITY_DN5155_c0_g1_i1.p1 TRINITY_DN5155_c0_g1~~TRINITY_DN5155_c0_g1_i1.p1  ORF type:complete len:177 (-),score=41.78 TRINITY_DN5155_c0_g1_i1:513-1043(-)
MPKGRNARLNMARSGGNAAKPSKKLQQIATRQARNSAKRRIGAFGSHAAGFADEDETLQWRGQIYGGISEVEVQRQKKRQQKCDRRMQADVSHLQSKGSRQKLKNAKREKVLFVSNSAAYAAETKLTRFVRQASKEARGACDPEVFDGGKNERLRNAASSNNSRQRPKHGKKKRFK